MGKNRKNEKNYSQKREQNNNKPVGYGDKKLVGPNRPAE